ncbi:MAG: iron-containing alcohol dehydrogenase [Mediterranea sp.]|jgi:NADP-dependent alcohol dehydrogenase|nr:iron-containing alcohol dehydrogenase [Mediterranea sp.]
MKNFSFVNPVKIIFGKDTIQEIKGEIPSDNKVLVIYGGGSVKKNGVYSQVMDALSGYEVHEFSGIEPNPHYETCMKVVDVIKEKGIDYLLAVGGGSVIDATKFIAAAVYFEGGDPWDILSKGAEIKKALPFGTILTLPATGSEMNDGSVISRVSIQEKLSFGSPLVYPKFSVLDPTTTFTLSPRQVGNGVIDTFVHVTEQYLTHYEGDSTLQDRMFEGVLKTIVAEGPKALKRPTDYDVRANLMWASTWALNGWFGKGIPQDWTTHMIGHELTAFYGLDHARTLAIILPGVIRVTWEGKFEKIRSLGYEVFDVNKIDQEVTIGETIDAIEDFFISMGAKTHLSDYGLGDEAINKVYKRMEERQWKLGESGNITPNIVREILILRK